MREWRRRVPTRSTDGVSLGWLLLVGHTYSATRRFGGIRMVPIKTSVEDIEKVLGYVSRQIGFIEVSKVEKALGSIDARKIAAMVEFGLIVRDGTNVKITERGRVFSSGNQVGALR